MATFITALTGENGISATALWGAVSPVAPLVVIMILFALGYSVVKKSVKGSSKGKVRI